ncbi:UTP--glucose-1-phosphate uridylyltransferase [Halalkalibacter krulwichiae]|uniref:UTP--glucose-1-phosphate uridylyltransferase n=1 Tax=Halalkalibacter krulwichiae TaxID=199441 RepID=A0A1X9M5X4_9BACI|nr:UTP--glucose-1-phosphate uridylyltransferase [Halalkalibacter krulwichiae]ARK28847.1 UTP--glucose-1-phosphate uridylyltransferase [Halalkalibacter krulwichiae]
MTVKKAIIPAAGYGTRCLPITKAVPKELFPIGTRPTIHYIVEEAIEAGIEEILIVVSRSKNMIIDYFDRSIELETFLEQKQKQQLLKKLKPLNVQIQYIRQSQSLGLGDAIRLGESFVNNEPFAVLLPDEVIFGQDTGALDQLLSIYTKHNKSVLGLCEMEQKFLKNYGVVHWQSGENGLIEITDIVEKPMKRPPSNLAVIGRYIFTPSIFSFLKTAKPSLGGEIQLTDAIKEMLKEEKYYGVQPNGIRFDISRVEEFIAANQYILQSENTKM